MTEEQKQLFAELAADRIDSHRVFLKKSIGGIWRGIVEKYSDKAHFIYELLQNADDSQATEVRFEIRPSELLFAHNGTRHFTVSSVASEKGDVNAITAVAASNKQAASIGKFGVGFKSVFQYTVAPRIYDRDFCFRIDDYIVPVLLSDIPEDVEALRTNGWTVFVFPFKDGASTTSVSDIESKLESLDRPLLFLTHLRKIRYSSPSLNGSYETVFESVPNHDSSLHVEKVNSFHNSENRHSSIRELFLKFSKHGTEGQSSSVVFRMDADYSKLGECQANVYCFFPTQINPGLKFLIHAPFLLTDSREGIQDIDHNKDLIDGLGRLAADSLVFLRDWGIERGIPIINDSIFDVVPTNRQSFFVSYHDNMWQERERPLRFASVFTHIQSCLRNREMLCSSDSEPLTCRYAAGCDAYWAESAELPKLFDNKFLAELLGKPNAKWVFTTSGRPVASWEKNSLRDYKDSLIGGHFSFSDLLDKLTPTFLENRSQEWLERLYLFVQKHYSSASQLENAKSKSIFLGSDGAFHPATAPDTTGKQQPCLFLPSKDASFENATILEPSLLEKPELAKFFRETMRLQEPSIRDEVFNAILPKYRTGKTVERSMEDMKLIFRAWRDGNERDREDIVSALKRTPCIRGESQFHLPEDVYFSYPELKHWFRDTPRVYLDIEIFSREIGESNVENTRAVLNNV